MEIRLHILHVDDDPEDRWLLKESLQEIYPSIQLTQFTDGVEIMNYLNQLSPNTTSVHAIICDMQMPLMGGVQLLGAIKTSSSWKHLPVIIYSTSCSKFDINVCIENGARAFFTKPSTYEENLMLVSRMIEFLKTGELAEDYT